MAAVATGTLLGCYNINSSHGAGGMGEVYLANDSSSHAAASGVVMITELK